MMTATLDMQQPTMYTLIGANCGKTLRARYYGRRSESAAAG